MKFDTIIIGAGPAGIACAIKLYEAGNNCLVLERKSAPVGKVCGGGITPLAIAGLEKIGITTDDLIAAGGVKVEKYAHWYKKKHFERVIYDENDNEAYSIGISRDAFDELMFQKYKSLGGNYRFNYKVESVEYNDDSYVVNGEFNAMNIVYATGAVSNLNVSRNDSKSNFAVAARIKGKSSLNDGAFHFIYDNDLYGMNGYAWMFPIGKDYWNVGIGIFESPNLKDIKRLYEDFESDFLKEYFGDYTYETELKGAFLGVCSQEHERRENIWYIGDSKGLTSKISGEGISHGIISGIECAETIISR